MHMGGRAWCSLLLSRGLSRAIHEIVGSAGQVGVFRAHPCESGRSFVYDIADLYKVDITIPLAFDLVAQQVDDVSVAARRGIRDRMKDGKFMQRCVKDIRSLLLTPDEAESDSLEVEDITTQLWAGASGYRASGKNYSVESDMFINDDEDLHVDFDVEDGEF